jgi:hypothetical protein
VTKTDNKPQEQKRRFSPLRVLVGVLATLLLIFIFILLADPNHVGMTHRMICGANLKGLGFAIQSYAQDNGGKYPTVGEWCDLLVQHAEVSPKSFVCRGSDSTDGKSSYAMNRTLADKKVSDVAGVVVLLFETKGGWNQFGGAEILTTENHNGNGCYVLFNDLSVRFVKTENIRDLEW